MIAEIGQSARRLLKRPGLTAAALVTLTLAIGANSAIFSLLDAVALRPLPFKDADRILKIISYSAELQPPPEVSWPKYEALAAETRTLSAVTAYYQTDFGLTERDHPENLTGIAATASFFDVWGVQPLLGRSFSPAEEVKGGPHVVLLSHGFWQKRFGGDRAILGKTLEIEGMPTTVIGVLPPSLSYPFAEVQIWLPRPDEANFLSAKAVALGAGYLQVAARAKPGVSLANARADIDRVIGAYLKSPSMLDTQWGVATDSMNDTLVGAARTKLLFVLAIVGLVLLIACSDVASLLLADGLARRREFAARIALGAGRGRILGQTLLDSLLLAFTGAALGLVVAHLGLRLLVAANPADLPRIGEATLSGRAFAFTLVVTLVAGLISGLLPAWQTLGTDPKRFLAEGERGSSGGGALLGQGLLVTLQVAIALLVLSTAGLLLRSLHRVNSMDLGLTPENLLLVQVTLPAAKYPSPTERAVFFDQLLERVRALPGVKAVGLVDYPPISSAPQTTVTAEGQAPLPPDKQQLVFRGIASSGYFAALNTRFLSGHDFDPHLAADAPLVGIINRSLRDHYFPGQNPIGKHLALRGGQFQLEVVGVVENIQQQPLEAGKGEPMYFLYNRQVKPEMSPSPFLQLAIRTGLPIASVAGSVRREVAGIDPSQPLPEMTSMSEMLAGQTSQRRLVAELSSGFSLLALGLCLLGIYGLVAQTVNLRRREIGIRMALGSAMSQVLGSVVRRGAMWIAPGLLLGGLLAYVVATKLLTSQLFEVAANDLGHFALAATALAGVALLACVVPARRATRIDPSKTLRQP
jgi:putative ABC transport system permease protein